VIVVFNTIKIKDVAVLRLQQRRCVFFLDVIHNPLHPEATQNLALISDLENLCTPLSSFSPGAKRHGCLSRDDKVVLDIIKARAKRKAQDNLDNVRPGQSRLNQCRTEDPQSSIQGVGRSGPSIEACQGNSRSGGVRVRSDEHPFNPLPANFSWDDWDQCLNDAAL
jgi:hypothetical protein